MSVDEYSTYILDPILPTKAKIYNLHEKKDIANLLRVLRTFSFTRAHANRTLIFKENETSSCWIYCTCDRHTIRNNCGDYACGLPVIRTQGSTVNSLTGYHYHFLYIVRFGTNS
jgi:hypothetical protein